MSTPNDPEAPGPSGSLGRVRDLVVAVVCASLALMLGQGILFLDPRLLFLGPLVGTMCALACRRPLDAALAAAVSLPLGTLLATLVSQQVWGPATQWLPDSLVTAGVAALVAAGASWAMRSRPRMRPLLTGFAIALIVLAMSYAAIGTTTKVDAAGGSVVRQLSLAQPLTAESNDHELFLRAVARVRAGSDYYRAMGETLVESDRAGREVIDAASSFSYRLPTLYVLFAAMPPNGTWIVLSMVVVGALAAVAAYLLARTEVSAPVALVGCAAVAAYFGFVAMTFVSTFTEPYAGALGLVAVALFALSRRSRGRAGLVWAAAIVALLAAMIRELAAPFVFLGLVATLVDRDSRERGEWLPWTLALALVGLAYTGHVLAVREVAAELGAKPIGDGTSFGWLNVDGLGLRAAVYRFAGVSAITEAAAWVAVAAGWIGGIFGSRSRGVRVFAGAVAFGGAIIYLFVHPNGTDVAGLPPGYWGDIIVPTAIACIPLSLGLYGWMREPGTGVASSGEGATS